MVLTRQQGGGIGAICVLASTICLPKCPQRGALRQDSAPGASSPMATTPPSYSSMSMKSSAEAQDGGLPSKEDS